MPKLASAALSRHITSMADSIPSTTPAVPTGATVMPGGIAPADTAPAAPDFFGTMMPMMMVLVVIYLFMWRPQQKRMQAQKQIQENLKKGDEVLTAGGLIGHISSLGDNDEIMVELAEGVRVRALRSMLTVHATQNAHLPPANDDRSAVSKKNSGRKKDSQRS